MKILLTTLNSKYVHSNLALKYLYTVVADEYSDVEVREFTINQEPIYIYTELLDGGYDMICFSCYIWNIEGIKALASDLKKAKPDMKICLGGPAVSHEGLRFAVEHPWADLILCGEGEYSFYRLCQIMMMGEETSGSLKTVPGLIYQVDGNIYANDQMEPMDFNLIPFPYSILNCKADQVVYYESVRGCPFRCTYCLSSIDKTLRPLKLERVKSDLKYFLYKKVMQVKFIDRTFNYDRKRAYEIFRYLMENDNGVTNFHFEICGDLLDRETLELLAQARKGLFQLEIGIQSANPDTLKAIGRNENVYPLLHNVEQLVMAGNIHTHVDLIAGLPYETYELFARSFNKVYALGADTLQLGFLKVLAGTPICDTLQEHGIVYRDKAPYEVICTNYISAEELARLHRIENLLDIYYNRGGFRHTLRTWIPALGKGAFGFFEDFADFYYGAGYQHRNRKKEDQYRILRQFGQTAGLIVEDDVQTMGAQVLHRDLKETFNEEEQKRFYKKGWEVTI
ncbi:MAG: DUF4080 domain-containing protein [Firmicutes bacterium]|nr:DUF4080 domain-containing protein [Bacillota bacterium]